MEKTAVLKEKNNNITQTTTDSNKKIINLSVIKRNGSITPFKADKIANAIKKAFLAQTKIKNNTNDEENKSIHKNVSRISSKVVAALTRRIADGDMIHIEDIQDQVELALMRDEQHKIARAYVLYREQRAAQRYHTNRLKQEIGGKVSSMQVLKRDGSKELVSLDKISNRVSILATGLSIDQIIVAQKAIAGLYDNITTKEIDNYLAETAAAPGFLRRCRCALD